MTIEESMDFSLIITFGKKRLQFMALCCRILGMSFEMLLEAKGPIAIQNVGPYILNISLLIIGSYGIFSHHSHMDYVLAFA